MLCWQGPPRVVSHLEQTPPANAEQPRCKATFKISQSYIIVSRLLKMVPY